MRSSHKQAETMQIVNSIIDAAERFDPVLINEFFALTIDLNYQHLNVIDDTLPLKELIHRQRVLSQGATFLAMFNYFATREVQDGLGKLTVPSA